ncbi:hypothetical protein LO80_01470 [Candidatus Francisella endociliophora]|uniref:Uncharacterized protein n=1 Tax=Candidatus Francisella endociliophora TaxID=653937 RepID=A0A097EMH5_9GAMM|nr:hypothetical protein [Francisella sp. FSC1006]AIT08774.1 hypothetical protein LO80_01470 [Francisella sp. FSC1006]
MFNKKLLAATVAMSLTATAIGATNMDIIKKDNNPLGNEPYAEVAISANGSCDYQILINDVPIYADEGAINTTLPVNPYMINGSNNLAVTVQNKDESCKVSATLQVRKSDDFNSTAKLNTVVFDGNPSDITEKDTDGSTPAEKLAFADGKFDKSDDGYITVSKAKLDSGNVYYGYNYDNQKRELMAGVKVSQDIDLPIDLPKWAWLDGETIANDQATKDALIAIYKEIWADIQNKDWDKLNKLFASRDAERAKAYYTGGSNGTTADSIREKIEDAGSVFVPKEKTIPKIKLNIFGKGKLATMTSWNNGELLSINKKEGGSSKYGVTFAKINGKFVIVG